MRWGSTLLLFFLQGPPALQASLSVNGGIGLSGPLDPHLKKKKVNSGLSLRFAYPYKKKRSRVLQT